MSAEPTESSETAGAAADATGESGERENPLPIGRFGRLIALVAFVTAVFLFISAQTLSGRLFQIAVVVVGSIAVITASTGFLISVASYVGDERER